VGSGGCCAMHSATPAISIQIGPTARFEGDGEWVLGEGERGAEGARGSISVSPTSPPDALVWRSRFVLNARRRCATVTLLGSGHDGPQLRLAADAVAALDAGIAPVLVDDGLGGSYFIKGRDGDITAVFKPRDEEPCAVNNPKASASGPHDRRALGSSGLRSGILIGEAALNECMAYLLDSTERARHFCQVPATASVRTEHVAFFDSMSGEGSSYDEALQSPFRIRKEKVGSLQRFVANEGSADDFSYSIFPTLEVQRIAVLDVRLFNTDRHGGNILVCRHPNDASRLTLAPIDHGFCLPEAPTVPAFEWRDWPQARAPLEPAVLEYIARIDVLADAALLRGESGGVVADSGNGGGSGGGSASGAVRAVREGCVRTMRIGTLLLQLASREGLSLSDMAEIMCEPCDEVWAALGASVADKVAAASGQRRHSAPAGAALGAAPASEATVGYDRLHGGLSGTAELRRASGGTALQRLCQHSEAEALQRVYYTGTRLRKQLSPSERNALHAAAFYETLQRRTQVFIAAFKHVNDECAKSEQDRKNPTLRVAIHHPRGPDHSGGYDPSPSSITTMDL